MSKLTPDELRARRRIYAARYVAKHPDRVKASQAKWSKANPKKRAEASRRYAQKYPDEIRLRQQAKRRAAPEKHVAEVIAWQQRNPDKVAVKQARYMKEHADRVNARTARRYAAKTNATPTWADQDLIEQTYTLARLLTEHTGEQYQVDHEVPLRSRLVCGLHVENNLQVIPKRANQLKGNRYWPDMP